MSSSVMILISIGVFVFIIVLCVIGYFLWQQTSEKNAQSERVKGAIDVKLESISFGAQKSMSSVESQDKAISQLRKDKTISAIPLLDILLHKIFKENIKVIRHTIEQTGFHVKVAEFILFSVLLGLIGALLVDLFFKIPFAGIAIGIVPFAILNVLREKRKSKFVSQMPAALDMMNADLRAGVDIQQAIKHIAEELSPPISEEFQRMVAEINLGVPVDESLLNLSERIDTMDVQMLCTGIIINRQLGGNLAELVANVAGTVRERFRLQGVIKALTAESTASSYLLLALPIGLFFVLNLLAPQTYNSFTQTPMGINILKGCCVSMVIGFVVLKKMTKIEA